MSEREFEDQEREDLPLEASQEEEQRVEDHAPGMEPSAAPGEGEGQPEAAVEEVAAEDAAEGPLAEEATETVAEEAVEEPVAAVEGEAAGAAPAETEGAAEHGEAEPAPEAVAQEAAEAAVEEAETSVQEAVEEPAAAAEAEAESAQEAGEETAAESMRRAQAEEPDDGRRWYVVHCYSGYENKVRHNLEQRIETMGMKDKIFDVVVPTEEEIEVKEGKRRTVERRVFPGYILVQMIMTEESWYVVRNTPGVTGFVGMGNEPTPLRPEEVAQIIKRMEAEAPRIKVTYNIGQKVRIIDGPFNDFIGTVDDIDMERAKVRVMVSFFGRETPVELDFLQVEKA
jgi:transcriptional antiterminator NusG